MSSKKLPSPKKKSNQETIHYCRECIHAHSPHELSSEGLYFLIKCDYEKWSKFLKDKSCDNFFLRNDELNLKPNKMLKKSNVIFDEEKHKYSLNGLPLSGITGILHNMLFPSMYANVDPTVLKNKATRGSAIHHEIEDYIKEGKAPVHPDAIPFCSLPIVPFESEYLVSDNKNIASSIDVVCSTDQDGYFDLYDIKTTYELHKDYVRWQLSIYAWLFELNNPDLHVKNIGAIHLKDQKANIVYFDIIDKKIVENLIDCYVNMKPFDNPFVDVSIVSNSSELTRLHDVEIQILEMKDRLKELENQESVLKEGLMKIMIDNNIKKYDGEMLSLTVKEGYVRKSLDSKALEADFPDIYKSYQKETNVKPTLLITKK